MNRNLVTLLALALVAVSPAAVDAAGRSRLLDEKTLLIAPEERVVVQYGEGGRLDLVSAEPAADRAAEPPAEGSKAPPGGANQASPGQIVFTLTMGGPSGTVLKIENGTDRPLDYQAALVRFQGGRTQFTGTSVCTLLPKISNLETWPETVDAIAVRNLLPADHEGMVCR